MDARDFAAHEGLGAREDARVAEELRRFVERRGGVFQAEEGDAAHGNFVVALQELGQMGHGAGTLDQIQLGAVAAAQVVHAAITGNRGDDLDADFLEIPPDEPGFAGDVEIAQDVD